MARDQSDTGGCSSDQDQQCREQCAPPDAVTQVPTDHTAERASDETHEEADVGQQQRASISTTHDVDREISSQQAIDAVVVPLHEGADGTRDRSAAERGVGSLFDRGLNCSVGGVWIIHSVLKN
ncbi:hypothetical protein SDC9_153033 [bioreactor metagenome]|uniref:Uncharacterized protein n=1 Tax=bioreactor metagenome TaxID=1076179 RepID=A0A645EWG2_9ZZZZ